MTDNTPPVALEPCPFCKATPHQGLGKVEHCQLHGEPFQRFSIWCPHGCAKITRSNADIARRDWNRRAPDKALVEALANTLNELWEARHSSQSREDFEREFISEFDELTKARAGL